MIKVSENFGKDNKSAMNFCPFCGEKKPKYFDKCPHCHLGE